MIAIHKKNTNDIRNILLNNKFSGGGHYCYNIDLLAEIKDGPYRLRNILKSNGMMQFYVVCFSEDPIIIAPLFISQHTATVAGTDECFDYVDLFYKDECPMEIIESCFDYFFGYLKQKGIVSLRWNYVPEESISRILLTKYKSKVTTSECTKIQFSDYEEYTKILSKSTKQNLRTAENRLNRDKYKYDVVFNIDIPLSTKVVNKCIDIYCSRQVSKYHKGLVAQMSIKTINFSTAMMRKQKGVIFALLINGDVGAFMFGYVNPIQKSLEIPKLAISDKYNFYSPGMILLNKSIKVLFDSTDIRTLDLCRGTEQYKLKMGGEIYNTYNYLIRI